MESGRSLYYDGNTIAPKNRSKRSVTKRLEIGLRQIQEANHVVPIIDKTYATLSCEWCPKIFQEYRIVCDSCRNCQYCGLAGANSRECKRCGNKAPEELFTSVTKIKVV